MTPWSWMGLGEALDIRITRIPHQRSLASHVQVGNILPIPKKCRRHSHRQMSTSPVLRRKGHRRTGEKKEVMIRPLKPAVPQCQRESRRMRRHERCPRSHPWRHFRLYRCHSRCYCSTAPRSSPRVGRARAQSCPAL